jgi:hypothetical protein
MRYILAGVLVVVAAGVDRAEEPAPPRGLIGMEQCDVEKALGYPGGGAFWAGDAGPAGTSWYTEIDCLGGRHELQINYISGKVTNCRVRYKSFAARPPWLEWVRAAFSPPEE